MYDVSIAPTDLGHQAWTSLFQRTEHSPPQVKVAMRCPDVLVVEDEPIIQRIHHMYLEKAGCRVDVVGTGEDALDQFSDQYDFVLLDIDLPDMKGFGICKYIRSRFPSLPVVFVSSHVLDEVKEACIAAGGTGYFQKPADYQQLIKTMERLLPHCIFKP